MTHHAKAPSAGSTQGFGIRRGLFGLVCLCVLALMAFVGSGVPSAAADPAECPNEALRTELHAGILGDCRAWELASPGSDKDVMADTGRTVAAATESPGLPMAAKFSSLGGFADVRGFGIGTDYLSQRNAAPGTVGWTTHAITPPQEPLSFRAAISAVDPLYEAFNSDLSRGVFRSFSSLPGTSTNSQAVPNLYLRDDLRTPGVGDYQLLSDSVSPQAAVPLGGQNRPWLAGTSTDLQHILFETKRNLTSDASGTRIKLYKSDGGVVRLVRSSSTCAGANNPTVPCSMAGIGAAGTAPAHYTPRVISADGSRVNFTSPFVQTSQPNSTPGFVSKLFQLDDQGTIATDDDAVIQLNASEKASPEPAQAAIYQTASTDGSRVFFTSGEQLTNEPGSGLYMWERQATNERQSVAVDATGGTFTLTAHSQPSYGSGTLVNGSNELTGVSGSFTVGQTISAPGIPAGTTIETVNSETLTLSAAATEDATEKLISSFAATTGSLPWDATAPQLQSALEGLTVIGTGNVAVSDGPGGSSPFTVEFTGGLAGVNVMELSSDPGGLTGGAETATVTTTNDIHNLTLIGGGSVLGASEDGHRVYFASGDDVSLWQDDGTPGGTLAHVAKLVDADAQFLISGQEVFWNFSQPLLSRVTPDGKTLLFEASDGTSLPPGYQHGSCSGNANGSTSGFCSEVYVYRADSSTPSRPDIVCASCNLALPGSPGDTFLNVRKGVGGSLTTSHLSHAISDDGGRVFFNTAEALVPEDTNGAVDVYEYDVPQAEVHLISTGTEPAPSYFMDSSADGRDVFFVTRARLVGWDDDQAYDLYDARVGGGFSNPPAQSAPCQGESCRLAPPSAPATEPVGSGQSGQGNKRHGRKPCPKGRRAVKRKGRLHCVRKGSRRDKNANGNRRVVK